ncbi:MAG: LacI family DNA-binding transcriptional regulator [Corynebacterium sp.]|nr:LacI family DNA-binding transcriptional regulator [Corynebacterium sp.]
MGQRVLMSDVAAFAGVSLQTVSRVVNGSNAVSEATREKVSHAIRTLGYRPNLAARTLAAGQSRALGVLITGDVDFGMSSAFRAVEHAAREQNYYLCVATASDPSRYGLALGQLADQRVAGYIVLARSADVLSALAQQGARLPSCLVLTGQPATTSTAVVAVDQVAGMRLLVDHVIAQGAQTLCHIAGDMSWDDAVVRATAFEQLCQERGVRGRVVAGGGWSAAAGYTAANVVIESGLPDAILACNDNIALGVLRACHEADIAVPDRLMVTGFDNTPLSEWTWPSLTSVTQDFQALGTAALTALTKILDGRAPTQTILIPELVARESTGKKGN